MYGTNRKEETQVPTYERKEETQVPTMNKSNGVYLSITISKILLVLKAIVWL